MLRVQRGSFQRAFSSDSSKLELKTVYSANATYNSPGPYGAKLYTWKQHVGPVAVEVDRGRRKGRDITAKIWYPISQLPGPEAPKKCPFVLFTNGFRMISSFYTEYAQHLASWGYVVGQYDLINCFNPLSLFENVDDATLVQYSGSAKYIVEAKLSEIDIGVDIEGMDWRVAGHSRGGKISALIGTNPKDNAKSMFLIDPVDNVSQFTPVSGRYPSAVAALKKGNYKLGVAGSCVGGMCNPASANYHNFYKEAAIDSWLITAQEAGHMQFLKANWFIQFFLNCLCCAGQTTNEIVMPLTKAFMVAWFERTLKSNLPPNDVERMIEFLIWAEEEKKDKAITFEKKEKATATDVRIRFIAAGPCATHCLAVDVHGLCFAWGRNESGQLGVNDCNNRDAPTAVEGLVDKKITAASCGKRHTVFIASDGSSWSCGWNGMGQCGTGFKKSNENSEHLITTPAEALVVKNCTSVACGAEFTLWLCDGKLYAAGNPQYGVLGDGSDHMYNAAQASVKIMFDPVSIPQVIKILEKRRIIKIAAGSHHCLAIDSDGIPYSWGNGNYGRLGHRVQRDEFIPRPIEFFLNIGGVDLDNLVVAAGGTSSFCTAYGGQLYSWGLRKPNAESEMYPRPFYDFEGWKIRSMSCGQGTFSVAAEQSVMTWGQAMHGENAHGLNGKKTCANPEKCSSLEDVLTHQVASGVGFNLFLVDPENEKISELPVYDPDEADVHEEAEETTEVIPKRRVKRRKKSSGKQVEKKPRKRRPNNQRQSKIQV
eukprot:g3144.t1